MKKRLLTIVLFAIASTTTFSQLKVSQNGGIGLGIEPRTDYKLIMKGDLLLTTYPEIPPSLPNYTEFRIKVGNGSPGCEFGTPTKKIAVWSSEAGYNFLYAAVYFTASDSRLKADTSSVQNGVETIMQMKPYSYYRRDTLGGEPSSIREYGFLAQDIAEFLPELVDSAKDGILLVNYQQIIPFIVAAIKEQQNIIDSLKNQEKRAYINSDQQQMIDSLIREINEVKNQMAICCDLKHPQLLSSNKNLQSNSTLTQNSPNPFSEKTVIEFEIVENFRFASIAVFDMQGTLKKTIPIYKNGKGNITINGFELTAGMYLYSLIVDDKEIDTKRMILLN